MPKKPTDTLDGLRFELNEKERELVSRYITTEQIKIILPQIIDIVTDPKKLYIIGVIYELVTGKDLPFIISGIEDAQEAWTNIKVGIQEQAAEVAREGADDLGIGISQYADIVGSGPFGIFNLLIPSFIRNPLGTPEEIAELFRQQQEQQEVSA